MPDAHPSKKLQAASWSWRTALVLVLVGLSSWLARESLHRRVELPTQGPADQGAWITLDPDSLYQMRRVERALDTPGAIANEDAYLNFPAGASIPWPPYYTRVLTSLLRPLAPPLDGTQESRRRRHAWIERSVARMPAVFGVLTSILAALTAWRVAGDLAALLAGGYHALCMASIAYSKVGNGDHHAWVALLAGALLALLTFALARGAEERTGAGALWGSLVGVCAGLLLGSWVASMVFVVEVQVVLAWLILRNGRAPQGGLAAFGATFHLAALLTVLPAVLASPWRAESPWQAVNLSWFHPTFLTVGALVFLPLPWLRARPAARRAYPWLVLFGLAAGAGLLLGLDAAPARGVREGFQWMSKVDAFMAGISESRPLVGPRAGMRALDELGYGLLALPLALAALLVWGLRASHAAWVPLAAGVLLRSVQAAYQARFGDAFSLPLAVLLGIGGAWLLTRIPGVRRVRPLGFCIALAIPVLLHPRVSRSLIDALGGQRSPQAAREGAAQVAAREACEWLAEARVVGTNTPSDPAGRSTPGAVLANWSFGHCIEWAAGRPSLATNFGTYVGEAGFRAAPRFLLGTGQPRDWQVLDDFDVAYVLVTSQLPSTLSSQISAAGKGEFGHLLERGIHGTDIRGEWFDTLGARLLRGGRAGAPGMRPPSGATALERLRLVYVAPVRDPQLSFPGEDAGPQPAALVWQVVPGALLEARGAPGATLSVDLAVRFPRARYTAHFQHAAVADDAGVARLRVPYATEAPTGNGRIPADRAQVTFGARSAPLRIPERAVLEGQTLTLDWPH